MTDEISTQTNVDLDNAIQEFKNEQSFLLAMFLMVGLLLFFVTYAVCLTWDISSRNGGLIIAGLVATGFVLTGVILHVLLSKTRPPKVS